MGANNDGVSIRSLRGRFFGFGWMGAFYLRAEHFSLRLALVGPTVLSLGFQLPAV